MHTLEVILECLRTAIVKTFHTTEKYSHAEEHLVGCINSVHLGTLKRININYIHIVKIQLQMHLCSTLVSD